MFMSHVQMYYTKNFYFPIDVIGIIQDPELTLVKFQNRLGQPQTQMKFTIIDGTSQVKVTFWDQFAELFDDTLKEDFEYPLILIIGSARITEWKGNLFHTNDFFKTLTIICIFGFNIAGQVDISNVGATTFYLNYQHHSVHHLRQM